MNTLEAAKIYLSHGWSVIPIVKGSKKPHVKWRDLQKRLPTVQEWEKWYKTWPDCNIALICCELSGVFVIDFDSQDALEHYRATHDMEVLDTMYQETPHGFHAFFNMGSSVVPLIQPILPQTDLKGNKSYVLLEPSIHESGRAYKWGHLNPLTDGTDDILDPPSGFYKMLKDYEEAQKAKITAKTGAKDKSQSKNSEGWEQELLMGVADGERDVAATKLAGLYLSKDYAQGDTIVLLNRWNERNSPPLDEKDIGKCVRSIYRDHHKKNANGIANVIEKIIILRYPDGSNKYKLCLGNDKYALVTMDALMSSRRTVVAIADTTRLVFFPPKQEKWLALLKIWLSAAEEQVISIEESELGIIKEIIGEWLIKWEGQKDSKHIDHTTMLKNHCVVKDGIIYFTLTHLEEDLRFRNSKMTRTMLCEFLRRLGSKITEPRLRFNGARTRTWEIAEFSCE